jgi:hypothetical protein
LFNHAEVGMPGRLIVEVLRWAIACHRTDGTDPGCKPAQNVFTFSTLANARRGASIRAQPSSPSDLSASSSYFPEAGERHCRSTRDLR